jgi:ribosomal protein S18 acetylase RimI-like enzyme
MVELSVCGPDDVDELVDLLALAFTEHDPPAVAVGLSRHEFAQLVDLYRDRAGTEGLTVIARDPASGDIVGTLLAEDAAAAFPAGVERLSPKFDPIFDILTELESEYRRGQVVLPGDALHLFLLGVHPAFARQQIAQRLVGAAMAGGARRGYRLAVTEATNKVSQHVFRKLGFVDRVRRSYAGYRFAGRPVFSSIAEHEGPVLLDKEL